MSDEREIRAQGAADVERLRAWHAFTVDAAAVVGLVVLGATGAVPAVAIVGLIGGLLGARGAVGAVGGGSTRPPTSSGVVLPLALWMAHRS